MSNDTTSTIARRYFDDIWNRRAPGAIDQLLAEDVVGHVGAIDVTGRRALVERIAALDAVYDEPRFTVEDVIADRDRVAVRWSFRGTHTGEAFGASPTGRVVSVTGCSFFRLDGGRIAELWLNADDLGELQQLGALPGSGQRR